MHLSFLTSQNLLFFSLCKTSKKTTFSVFLSFSLVKLSKSRSLKLNILRTAWPILMVLVSFCRILNGLPDEINLFWRCSSPLTATKIAILTVGLSLKLHLSSYVAKQTQEFSIAANVIVLFLLWVIKDVII